MVQVSVDNMEEGYRKPGIEEFVPGFKYEFHGMTSSVGMSFMDIDGRWEHVRQPGIEIWSKCSYDPNDLWSRDIKAIKECLDNGQIRIKK